MSFQEDILREITPISSQDSFLVFDRSKDDFHFPLHYHPEYELTFLNGAKGVRRIVGNSIEEIENLELVFLGPNLSHTWEEHLFEKKIIREITVQFHEDLFSRSFLTRKILRPIKDMFERSTRGIIFSEKTTNDMAPRIMKISQLEGIDYFLEIISILYDLSISRNQRILSTATAPLDNFKENDKIKKVYDHLHENYAKKVTLDEVSKLTNMSNVTFNRFIKKRTGKTFVDYLNEIRIGYATRWLVEKDMNISEIAFACGFNSMANFNRIFKKNKDCTPTEYRQVFDGVKKIL